MKTYTQYESTTSQLPYKDMLRFCIFFNKKSTLTLLTKKNAIKVNKIYQNKKIIFFFYEFNNFKF